MEIELLIGIIYKVEIDPSVHTHTYIHINILFSQLCEIEAIINPILQLKNEAQRSKELVQNHTASK